MRGRLALTRAQMASYRDFADLLTSPRSPDEIKKSFAGISGAALAPPVRVVLLYIPGCWSHIKVFPPIVFQALNAPGLD